MPSGSKPGERRGGRQRGTPNKLTASVKEMVETALRAEGGVEYLRWASREQPAAFLSLVGRVLPLQLQTASRIEVSIVHTGRELELVDTAFAAMQRPKLIEAVPVDVNDAAHRAGSDALRHPQHPGNSSSVRGGDS